MSKDIHVFDDILPIDKHQALHEHIIKLPMKWGWKSSTLSPEYRHWNYTFHESRQYMPAMDDDQYQELVKNHLPIAELWDEIKIRAEQPIGVLESLRIYMNANPYGTNGYIHTDDGDYTAIYYPYVEWDAQWEGGTCFYEKLPNGKYDAMKYVSYVPNRLVIFPAKTFHRAMPVDRSMIGMRQIIAFKLQFDVNDINYAKEFYSEKVQ